MRAEDVLPYAKPWILIDDALEVENGMRAVSIKNISSSDFYLMGHFPKRSIYPGMLLLEGIKQTVEFIRLQRKHKGNWLEQEISSRFLYLVRPGDRVKYVVYCLREDDAEISFSGEGWAGERKVIQAVLSYRKEGLADA
jgi:3-hydroxyacyl-[acyl-carrier-protein] dehydratase